MWFACLLVYLFHVVDHEYDDATGIEEENCDDVDQGISLHLPTLLTGQGCGISKKYLTIGSLRG
jgi:hypothetical protein